MRNLFTITSRELGAYFNSPIGAIFLIVFALIASGLFVTEFFLFPVAELRSFFNTIPFIFCVFVPAVTMRLWAEERSNNTVELLLTFPMRPMSLVLGKYTAALCFLLLALGSTLILPLMLMALGYPDLGQIASSYLGAILLGGFFLALGQLVSGFAKDQIVAFVLSLLACFVLFLLGTNFAATALDAWIDGLGSGLRQLLGVTSHYAVFTRGIIDLTDVAYFLVWTALCLFLNGMHIEGRGRKNFGSLFGLSLGLCLAIGLVFTSLAKDLSLGRFDWTEDKLHTVSDASKRILSTLPVPVQVAYYVTPEADMPTEIKTLERDVLDLLEELQRASQGKLSYKVVHMHAANILGGSPLDQSKESADGLEQRMLEKGIEPFSVSAMRQTGAVSDLIYSSLGVAYKDKPEEIIPQIIPDRLGELEYYLMSTAFRLAQTKEPVVAMVGAENFDLLRQVLIQEKLQVKSVSISAHDPLPQESDVILLLQPQALSERQVWEIQHALASGRKVILAAQTSEWDYDMAQGSVNVTRTPLVTGLENMLDTWGLSLSPKVLLDEQNIPLRVARNQIDQFFGGGMSLKLPTQIMLTKESFNPDEPLTQRLGDVFFLWGAAITLDQDKLDTLGLNATVLASSSPRSWLAEVPDTLTQAQITPPADTQAYPLMAQVKGQFPLPTEPAPPWPTAEDEPTEQHLETTASPSEMLIIGGSSMFGNEMLQHNIDLIMNALDAMAFGPDLIQIRGKKMSSRIIMNIRPAQVTTWKILAYGLPVTIIAALALSRAWNRQRRRTLFAQKIRKKT